MLLSGPRASCRGQPAPAMVPRAECGRLAPRRRTRRDPPRARPMTRRREAARLLVRSLFVQGSINERTLIGSGFSWALLPPSRSTGREGTEAEAVVPGPEESFNSHPYLTPLALGATARARADGMPSTELRSFLTALRSPLGSLGDRLIWSTWRPLCLLGALLGIVLGVPPAPLVAGVFLVYNGLHIFLRVWGLRVGLAHGAEVAPALGAARLPARSERLAALGVLILRRSRRTGGRPRAGTWGARRRLGRGGGAPPSRGHPRGRGHPAVDARSRLGARIRGPPLAVTHPARSPASLLPESTPRPAPWRRGVHA